MANLMKKNPHDMTNAELTQLNSYLKQYGKDPLFAEELTTKVGPKATLAFYAGIADPYQGQGIGTDPKARMEPRSSSRRTWASPSAPPPSPTARTCRSGRRT